METIISKELVLKFFKNAFGVDGEVNLIPDKNKFKIAAVVKLKDSERGTFYVGILKELNK